MLRFFKTNYVKATSLDFLKNFFFISSFLFFFGGYSFRFFSDFIVSTVGIVIPAVSVRVCIFLISNDTITASFLAAFIGKKIAQGYRYKEVVMPIVVDLYKVSRRVKATKVGLVTKAVDNFFSAGYRSSIVKSFGSKFFSIYKRLYFKFFSQNHS
jgi:hypothetical protein